jgi:hypothetical protein
MNRHIGNKSAAGAFVSLALVSACGSSPETIIPVSIFENEAGSDTGARGDGAPNGGQGMLGGGLDASTSPGKSDASCGSIAEQAQVVPLDLYIMLDASGSMAVNDKWTSIQNAIGSFLNNPLAAGLGVGIQYFPILDSSYVVCDPNVYATPAVSIYPLPANAQTIGYDIQSIQPTGGTPTGPALQGALQFAQGWATNNPTHDVVVVLATDGVPDSACSFAPPGVTPNTLEGVEAVAAAAYGATTSIPTYVIGVGSELTLLNAVAVSGGTSSAFIVDTTQDTGAQFLAALDAIRHKSLACAYPIPAAPAGMTTDFTKVNVELTPSSGAAVDFLYVANAANCGQTPHGWYYDNPSAPTRVIICDSDCEPLKDELDAQIDILFGCQTNSIIPR